jgi:hypothetical protein
MLQHDFIRGQIAFLSNLVQNKPVTIVVKVIMIIINIKEGVIPETQRLVDLKAQTDRRHILSTIE